MISTLALVTLNSTTRPLAFFFFYKIQSGHEIIIMNEKNTPTRLMSSLKKNTRENFEGGFNF